MYNERRSRPSPAYFPIMFNTIPVTSIAATSTPMIVAASHWWRGGALGGGGVEGTPDAGEAADAGAAA